MRTAIDEEDLDVMDRYTNGVLYLLALSDKYKAAEGTPKVPVAAHFVAQIMKERHQELNS